MSFSSATVDVSALAPSPAYIARQKALKLGLAVYGLITLLFLVCSFAIPGMKYSLAIWMPTSGALLILYAILFGNNKDYSGDKRLMQFAADNHLSYIAPQNYSSNGIIFQVGNDHETRDMIQGELYGYPYRLYWHRFTLGYGREKETDAYGVFEIDLPQEVPQIFIDSIANHKWVKESLDIFRQQDMWQLEGDFSNYFNVYAVKKYASAVLTLLNPGFMQALIQNSTGYEIELIEQKAYIYIDDQYSVTPYNVEKLYTAAEFLILQLQKQLDTFRFKPDTQISDELSHSALKHFRIF